MKRFFSITFFSLLLITLGYNMSFQEMPVTPEDKVLIDKLCANKVFDQITFNRILGSWTLPDDNSVARIFTNEIYTRHLNAHKRYVKEKLNAQFYIVRNLTGTRHDDYYCVVKSTSDNKKYLLMEGSFHEISFINDDRVSVKSQNEDGSFQPTYFIVRMK